MGWVPRGVANSNPDKIRLTDKELADLMKNMTTDETSEQEDFDPERTLLSKKDNSKTRKRKLAESLDEDKNSQKSSDQSKNDDWSDTDDEENPLSLGGKTW